MILRSSLAFLLIALTGAVALPPQFIPGVVRAREAAAGGGGSFTGLIAQRFEGTGYDNSETWTEGGTVSTVDEDNTTTPIAGSQDLRINTSADTGFTTSPIFTADGEVWGCIRFECQDLPPGQRVIAQFINTGGSQSLGIFLESSGALTLEHGSASASTTATLAADTVYYIWFYYLKGTGANGVGRVAFSSSGTEPTSGTAFAEITTGTRQDDIDRIRVGIQSNSTLEFWFDNVFVSATATVGDNPQ